MNTLSSMLIDGKHYYLTDDNAKYILKEAVYAGKTSGYNQFYNPYYDINGKPVQRYSVSGISYVESNDGLYIKDGINYINPFEGKTRYDIVPAYMPSTIGDYIYDSSKKDFVNPYIGKDRYAYDSSTESYVKTNTGKFISDGNGGFIDPYDGLDRYQIATDVSTYKESDTGEYVKIPPFSKDRTPLYGFYNEYPTYDTINEVFHLGYDYLYNQSTLDPGIIYVTSISISQNDLCCGSIDANTGESLVDLKKMRTKDYISITGGCRYGLTNKNEYWTQIFEYHKTSSSYKFIRSYDLPYGDIFTTDADTNYIKIASGDAGTTDISGLNLALITDPEATKYISTGPFKQSYEQAYLTGNIYFFDSTDHTQFCKLIGNGSECQGYERYQMSVKVLKEISTIRDDVAGYVSEIVRTAAELSSTIKSETSNLRSEIKQTSDKISLIVGADGKVDAASIVAAINDSGESTVKISADKVNIDSQLTIGAIKDDLKKEGYVTNSDLNPDPAHPSSGATVISGSLITTGVIKSSKYEDKVNSTYSTTGLKIDLDEGTLKSPGMCLDTDGNLVLGGSIRFETSPMHVVYSKTALPAPADKTRYEEFPSADTTESGNTWHTVFNSANDRYESRTYNSGDNWTEAIKSVAVDGTSVDGMKGDTVYEVTLYHLASNELTTEQCVSITPVYNTVGNPAPNGWSFTMPGINATNKYLYASKSTVTVTSTADSSPTTTFTVWSTPALISRFAIDGEPGKDGLDSYNLVIYSTNGSVFKSGDISTKLYAKVYKGGTEVIPINGTSSTEITYNDFVWTKRDKFGIIDELYIPNYTESGKKNSILIRTADVQERATFECSISK